MQPKLHFLWLPGWGFSSDIFHELQAYFPEARHETIEPSSLSSSQTLHHNMKQTLATSSDRWVLVGWSMGGLLALEFLLHEASYFDYVIIISSTLQFVDNDRHKGWPLRIVERMQIQFNEHPHEVLVEFVKQMTSFEESVRLKLMQYVLMPSIQSKEMITLNKGLQYLIDTDLTAKWTMIRHQLHTHYITLLWIHGNEDPVCPVLAMPADLSQNESFVVKGGHVLMLTHIEALATRIRHMIDQKRLESHEDK